MQMAPLPMQMAPRLMQMAPHHMDYKVPSTASLSAPRIEIVAEPSSDQINIQLGSAAWGVSLWN